MRVKTHDSQSFLKNLTSQEVCSAVAGIFVITAAKFRENKIIVDDVATQDVTIHAASRMHLRMQEVRSNSGRSSDCKMAAIHEVYFGYCLSMRYLLISPELWHSQCCGDINPDLVGARHRSANFQFRFRTFTFQLDRLNLKRAGLD